MKRFDCIFHLFLIQGILGSESTSKAGLCIALSRLATRLDLLQSLPLENGVFQASLDIDAAPCGLAWSESKIILTTVAPDKFLSNYSATSTNIPGLLEEQIDGKTLLLQKNKLNKMDYYSTFLYLNGHVLVLTGGVVQRDLEMVAFIVESENQGVYELTSDSQKRPLGFHIKTLNTCNTQCETYIHMAGLRHTRKQVLGIRARRDHRLTCYPFELLLYRDLGPIVQTIMVNHIPLDQEYIYNIDTYLGDAHPTIENDYPKVSFGMQSVYLIRLVQIIKHFQSLSIITVPFVSKDIQDLSTYIDEYPGGVFSTENINSILLQGETVLNHSEPSTKYFEALMQAEPQLRMFFIDFEVPFFLPSTFEIALCYDRTVDESIRDRIVVRQLYSEHVPFSIQLNLRNGIKANFELLAFIDENGSLHALEEVTTSYVVFRIYGRANEAETLILDPECDSDGRPTLRFIGTGDAFYGHRPLESRKTQSTAKMQT